MGGRADSTLSVDVVLPAGPAFAAVARLVAGGMGARLGLPVDRLEDLQLAIETIVSRSAPEAEEVAIRIQPRDDGLGLRVGPLPKPADLERVLSGLVDEVSTREVGGETWVELEVARRSLVRASR